MQEQIHLGNIDDRIKGLQSKSREIVLTKTDYMNSTPNYAAKYELNNEIMHLTLLKVSLEKLSRILN